MDSASKSNVERSKITHLQALTTIKRSDMINMFEDCQHVILNKNLTVRKLRHMLGRLINETRTNQTASLLVMATASASHDPKCDILLRFLLLTSTTSLFDRVYAFQFICRNYNTDEISRFLSAIKSSKDDLLSEILNGRDYFSRTPLMWASISGSADKVKLLLTMSPFLDSVDAERFTALLLAVSNNHSEVVDLLLQAGSSVDIKDQHGFDAIELSVWCGHVEIFSTLADWFKGNNKVCPDWMEILHSKIENGSCSRSPCVSRYEELLAVGKRFPRGSGFTRLTHTMDKFGSPGYSSRFSPGKPWFSSNTELVHPRWSSRPRGRHFCHPAPAPLYPSPVSGSHPSAWNSVRSVFHASPYVRQVSFDGPTGIPYKPEPIPTERDDMPFTVSPMSQTTYLGLRPPSRDRESISSERSEHDPGFFTPVEFMPTPERFNGDQRRLPDSLPLFESPAQSLDEPSKSQSEPNKSSSRPNPNVSFLNGLICDGRFVLSPCPEKEESSGFDEIDGDPDVDVDEVESPETAQIVTSAVVRNDIETLYQHLEFNSSLVNHRPQGKETLLMLATKAQCLQAVYCLVELGATVNAYFMDENEVEVTAMTCLARCTGLSDNVIAETCQALIDSKVCLGNGRIVLSALDASNFQVIEYIVNSEYWRDALTDYNSLFNEKDHDMTPFGALLLHAPQYAAQVANKMASMHPKKDRIIIDTDLVEETFIPKKKRRFGHLPIAKAIRSIGKKSKSKSGCEEQYIFLNPTIQLYSHVKWIHFSTFNTVYLLAFIPFVVSLLGYVLTLPRIDDMVILFTAAACRPKSCSCEDYALALKSNASIHDRLKSHAFLNQSFLYSLSTFIIIRVCFESLELLLFIHYLRKKILRKLSPAKHSRSSRISLPWVKLILEWPMIWLVLVVTQTLCDLTPKLQLHWHRMCCSVIVVIVMFDLLILVRKVPFFETVGFQIRIIWEMLTTFASLFLVFLVIVSAFAISFSLLFSTTTVFNSLPRSLVATTLMMIGDVQFEPLNEAYVSYHSELVVYVLIIVFVVFVHLMMINLFIGLITSDIERIKSEAKSEFLKLKIQFTVEIFNRLEFIYEMFNSVDFIRYSMQKYLSKFDKNMEIDYDSLPNYLTEDFIAIRVRHKGHVSNSATV